VLPASLFNLLSSHAGALQRHYAAILLRIYELAEFNRFGLTHEVVIAEIVDYLTGEGAEAMTSPHRRRRTQSDPPSGTSFPARYAPAD